MSSKYGFGTEEDRERKRREAKEAKARAEAEARAKQEESDRLARLTFLRTSAIVQDVLLDYIAATYASVEDQFEN
jgi:hypothetical protein